MIDALVHTNTPSWFLKTLPSEPKGRDYCSLCVLSVGILDFVSRVGYVQLVFLGQCSTPVPLS